MRLLCVKLSCLVCGWWCRSEREAGAWVNEVRNVMSLCDEQRYGTIAGLSIV
jgi:hypothetical protein